jgi:hypothetical protein
MPDMIPVGNTIIPPDPMRGINTLSGIIGIQQRRQQLQTQTAQAQQANQQNQELQALATFTKNAASDPSYLNDDGSPNIAKYQQGAMTVAPVYGQQYIGQMTNNFNGAIESRKALLALSNEQRATIGNYFATATDQASFLKAAELARGVSDDRAYQRTVDRMLINLPNTQGMTTDQAAAAYQQAAKTIAVQTQAPAAEQVLPKQMTTGAGVVNVQPITGAISAPPGAPPGSRLNPTVPQVAGQTARQTGIGNADVDTSNMVVAAQRDARTNIDLTKRIDQLADVVSPGRLPGEISSGLGALGLQDVNQARTELRKDLGQLRSRLSARAGSDERAATILSGLPTEETPTQTIHQSMDLTRGSARQDLALGQLQRKNSKDTNGQMNGFQGDYAHATASASPLMHEYFSLSPKEQVGFFQRNFKTKEQAQAFRAQAESVRKMSPDVVGQ